MKEALGTKRPGAPLLIDSPDKYWLVESGEVNIFSVLLEGSRIKGPWYYLLSVKKGEAFFGIDFNSSQTETGLIAIIAMDDTQIVEHDLCDLTEEDQSQSDFSYIQYLLDKWIENLSASIGKGLVPPRNYRNLQPGTSFSTDKASIFRAVDTTVWVEFLKGGALFMSQTSWPQITKGALFPVSAVAWIELLQNCEVRMMSTTEFYREHGDWTGLHLFHMMVLECIVVNNNRTESEEKVKFQNSLENDSLCLSSAISKLGMILDKNEANNFASPDGNDPLLNACSEVANALGMSISSPEITSGNQNKKMGLQDIARSSKFRFRKVILKGHWWEKDNGPLLAFRLQNNHPVALVPMSPRSYGLYDPVTATKKKISAPVAKTIAASAYSFYRPFPERPLTGMDLLKFGMFGCGKDLFGIFLMASLGAFLGLLTPYLTGILFETVIPAGARGQVIQISWILIVCALTILIFNITKGVALMRFEGRMDATVQAAVWDRLLALPVTFFRNYSAGDLTNRGMGINAIRQILSGATINSIISSIFSVFNLALMFHYSWRLTLLVTAITAIGTLFIIGILLVQINYQKKILSLEGTLSGKLLQMISGITKLRITGSEDRAFVNWAQSFIEIKKFSLHSGHWSNAISVFSSIFPILVSMAIFSWIVLKGMGSLSVGHFMAFTAAYVNFQNAVLQIVSIIGPLMMIGPIYQRAKPIIQTLPEADEQKVHPGELSGDIELNQVTFRYDQDGPLILEDVSLRVKSGEFVAIVGESGSGKSTLLRLMLGFESPENGALYYDGQDLASVDIREIRHQLGVVLQNGKLFPGDIFKNIVGSSNLSIEDAWEAAKLVGIDEDIKEMPMGMHTIISSGGNSISGGQRQRLLIARAIVTKPRILLFDEATSALDNRTQLVVSQSLERLKVTRVIVAHRLSTIINADRIYVLQAGKVVQVGSYKELINTDGLFSTLTKRQIA